MITPHFLNDAATIYRGDAVQILQNLEPNSVQAIITDPPYSSGGAFRSDRTQSTSAKYVQTSTKDKGIDFTGDNRDQRSFQMWMNLWVGEALIALEPGGIIGVFTDWRQLPTMTDALQVAGVVWRGIVPWHKPAARRTQQRPANNCEYFVWGTNGARSLSGSGAQTLDGFWQENSPRAKDHQTQKPVALMEWLAGVAPEGGTILDPFAGSGSTIVGALRAGRRVVGIEMSAHFCEVIARRVEQETAARVAQGVLDLEVTA